MAESELFDEPDFSGNDATVFEDDAVPDDELAMPLTEASPPQEIMVPAAAEPPEDLSAPGPGQERRGPTAGAGDAAIAERLSGFEAMLSDVLERLRGSADQTTGVVEREVRHQIEELTTAIRADMGRLEAKLDELGASLRAPRPGGSRTGRSKKAAAARKTAATSASPKKTAAKRPTARRPAAKKAAAKKRPVRKTAAKRAGGTGARARPNIWVTREEAENAWAVRRENSQRRLGTYRTQSEAKAAGRERAERDRVELIWQGKNGQIVGRNSYGNDDAQRKG
jgi:hypothetical protein